MNLTFTKPGREGRKAENTGPLRIEAITVVLTDATTITLVRGPHSYRTTACIPGTPMEADGAMAVPEMGSGVSNFLDRLPLDARTRATLFTLLNLESMKCEP